MKKLLLAIGLLFVASPALAQNPMCPTRPTGDNTNACASTAFVHTGIAPFSGLNILSNYTGASGDIQLANAIAAGATFVQLVANSNFFNTTPINLPTDFTFFCNGNYITQGANASPSVFTMAEGAQFINCKMNGNGTLFTGNMIDIVAGNNQRLINVSIVNTAGYNLTFANDVGGNFIWLGGSFNRTTFSSDAILLPASDSGTAGPRRFTDLDGNGSNMIDLNGGNYTVIEGSSMLCLDFRTASHYALIHNTRIACHPTILGSLHQLRGVIFDAGVTLGVNASQVTIEAQPGLTITDSSTNATNRIVPSASNTYTQYMAGGNTVGWQLLQAGSAALTVGTQASNLPYIRSQNSLALNFGVNATDYWQLGITGGLLSIAITGGDKGTGTINMLGCYVSNVACLTTASTLNLVVGTTTIGSGTTTRILYDNAGVLGEYTISGSGTQVAMATGPSISALVVTGSFTATGLVTNASLATMATNTVKGNATSGTASPTDLAVGTCSTAASALNWTTNTGFGCNTSITAAAVPVGGITGLGTGVATALAVNVGSAGAFVTFNGALGTPSSGTVTNLTGTASININGTVGATTPTTGVFTTLGSGAHTITATSANSLAVGRQGTTNPVLNVDASTATVVTGVNLKGAAAAGGMAVSVTSSGTDENLTIDAKGAGTITFGNTSTGAIIHTRPTTLSAALTYGGVTLSNSVTGTGSLVLNSVPTFTTSIQTPLIIGGTGTTGTQLTLKTTTGNGTTDAMVVVGGNNGGTTFGTFNATKLDVPQTTTSSSSTTGAITTAGGLGVVKNIFGGANMSIPSGSGYQFNSVTMITATNTTCGGGTCYLEFFDPSGNLMFLGGAGTDPTIYFNNTSHFFRSRDGGTNFASATSSALTVFPTTASTSKTTGSGIFGGGIGVAGATYTDTLNIITVANTSTTRALCWDNTTGLVSENGTVGTCTVSDIRLKNVEKPIPNALDKLLKITGFYYTWKDKAYGTGRQVGLSAQAVEHVFPELVQVDSKGIKSADYARLNSPIIEALREIDQRLQKLENRRAR